MSAALQVEGITVSPGGAPVLRDLSLDVEAASRTALVGPSGAGKTTLLRAIAGLERVVEGDVRLGGRSLRGVPSHRRSIAVVFQEPRLLPHLSVAENVALPLRASGTARAQRRRRASQLLEEVGLGAFADRRVPGLSGGEQQRVALARALCAEPELLLLDEPLAALDPNRREELRRLITTSTRQRGVTTLVVTHDRAEAAELGQRIALMLEGRIVQHDEPRALFERPVSAAVARFFGAVLIRLGDRLLSVRPEHIIVGEEGDLGGTVVEAVYVGSVVRLLVDCDGQRVRADVAPDHAPPVGATVMLRLDPRRTWPVQEPPGGRAVSA